MKRLANQRWRDSKINPYDLYVLETALTLKQQLAILLLKEAHGILKNAKNN
ncbi:hypothetical protein [Natranaerobius trueperi]|uniref:hypothetical protein n=1 Tax=Natranaerobius trueperi TaxID=759412 RepID=UPI00130396F2|nr:hypothetical protein [Natranaerobius trueperi]